MTEEAESPPFIAARRLLMEQLLAFYLMLCHEWFADLTALHKTPHRPL
jgi:hypothetical protein